jgi:hypothetical protein
LKTIPSASTATCCRRTYETPPTEPGIYLHIPVSRMMTNKEADGTVDEALYQATYWAVQDAASEALCWVLSNSVEAVVWGSVDRVVREAVLTAVVQGARQ